MYALSYSKPTFRQRAGIVWDLFLILVIFATGLVIPMRLIGGTERFDLFYAVVILVFLVDIIIIIWRGGDFTLKTLSDRQKLAHYLRGWFPLDILAAFPLAPFIFWMNGLQDIHTTSIILFTLMPLLKVLKLNKLFGELQEKLSLNPSFFRLIIFVFWIALSAHFIALGWILIGAVDSLLPVQDQYIRAIYWAVTTLSTVGYGDVTPDRNSHIQVIFSMVVMFLGVGMYGYVIGNIATLIANIDVAKTNYQRKMEEINSFLRNKEIPTWLQDRVRNYYKYLWEVHKSTSTRSVVDELPQTLREDIDLFLNRNILEKVPYFMDADENFIREAIREMELLVFLPGDFIIHQREFGDSMYFISSGEVEVEVDGQVVAKLGSGSFFGEASLVKSERRNASVRTLTYCDVNRLSQSSFESLLKKYPDFDQHVQNIVLEREIDSKKKTDSLKK